MRPYERRTPMLFKNREFRMRVVRTNNDETPDETSSVQYDLEHINDVAKDFVMHTTRVVVGGILIVFAAKTLKDTALKVVDAVIQ